MRALRPAEEASPGAGAASRQDVARLQAIKGEGARNSTSGSILQNGGEPPRRVERWICGRSNPSQVDAVESKFVIRLPLQAGYGLARR